MPSSSSEIPVIFDSDGGVDDAVALWRICTSPRLRLLAVTVTGGNVDVRQAAANLATVLAAAGCPEVPVAIGPPEPLGACPLFDAPCAVHGVDGLGDTGLPRVAFTPSSQTACELLVDLVTRQPGEITIIATGPLTNLALAVRQDPEWANRVDRLVFMGGSARRGGNATPLAEANIAMDPVAAAQAIGAGWRHPPIMVGLDTTLKATLGEAEFTLLHAQRNAAAAFLDEPMAFYRAKDSGMSDDGGCPCHDLLAVLVAEDESLVTTRLLPVAVDLGGDAAWGATVVDTRTGLMEVLGSDALKTEWPQLRVALDVDLTRFRAEVGLLLGHTEPERSVA